MPCRRLVLVLLASQLVSAQQITVRSQTLSATFDPAQKGAAVSLRDLVTGRELLAEQANPRLCDMVLQAPDGETVRLSNWDAAAVEVTRQNGTASLVLRDLGGRKVDFRCTVRGTASDRYLHWSFRVDLPDGYHLSSLRCPILVLRAPLTDGAVDCYVAGNTKGGVYQQPSAWKVGRSLGYRQPGSLAAQFACYYDAASGVTSEVRDADGYPKSLAGTRLKEGFELTWSHSCWAEKSFAPPYEVVVSSFQAAAGETDWRDAADLYKAWAIQQPWCAKPLSRRTDLPEWLRSGPAMVRFSRNWLGKPELIDEWLAGYYHQHFPADVPLLTAYWGWEKVATWVTPDYFPVYPSDEQFTALVERTRQQCAHAFLWPSGYHYTMMFGEQPDGTFEWDDRERYQQVAESHAVVGEDGKVLIRKPSWLRGGTCATMCPGDPWTIDWFNQISTEIAKRGGELVQVDQVVGLNFPFCYSTEHGHPPGPGLWMTEVMHRQMQTMLKACQAIEPEAVVCFEEPNEWYLQEIGIQDYRDWEVTRRGDAEPASVFSYLYHEYVPLFQSNPQSSNLVMRAYELVNGEMPHLVPGWQDGPGPALVGGDMEEWGSTAPRGWDKVGGYQGQTWTGDAAHDELVKHGGQASLRVSCDEPKETVQVSQNVPVGGSFVVGHKYRLSAWMRSQGLSQENGIGFATFADGLKGTGGGGRLMMPKSTEWTRVSGDFTVPEQSVMMRIMIHLTGPGTVWVDDLQLEELLPDGRAQEVRRPEQPVTGKLLQQWVALYHGAGRPYLFFGRMLHPPKLETGTLEAQGRTFAAILHNAFEAPDGSRAVILANPTQQPQTGKLTWNGKVIDIALEPEEVRLVTGP